MSKYDKIYRTHSWSYRKDGMAIFLPTRSVYIDMFTKLSSCMFNRCPFYGLTCNNCYYGT